MKIKNILNNILLIASFNLISSFEINNINYKNNYNNNNYNYNYNNLEKQIIYKLPYKSLVKKIEDHRISKIYFSKNLNNVISKENNLYTSTTITPLVTNNLVDISVKNNVDTVFYEVPPVNDIQLIASNFIGIIDSTIVPFIFITLIVSFIRSFFVRNQINTSLPNFFSGNNKINNDIEVLKDLNISLASFGGSNEIFEECTEVVSYLKNSTLYKNAGAEIPKGILLEGLPGTGKTLLAKAIASEANANFISISASEFVEVFVGVGALKIRNLFNNARNNLPCIIFIDEIDSIGKARGIGLNMGNDEREQTLNQLLAEMDGFTNNNGILVIAATNRKDVLDSALLRPGRFDRIINVPLPDRDSRKEIIMVHSKNKKFDSSINLDLIAELTNGFSGAQIKNLLNEAAIYAVRNLREIITESDILNSLDKIVIGLVRKRENRNNESIRRIAIHESGHALLCKIFNEYFDLKKVSIQSTYNGAGGYTLFNEHQNITDSGLYTKDLLKKRLIISLGGKAAEYLYYGADFVSVGAIQDLKQANSIAQKMIGNYGMGDELEVFYNENGVLYSDKRKEIFDKESLKLVIDAYKEAKNILLNNKDKTDILINNLLEKTVLYADDI
jgi:cell division protease FtsH